jgi:hypothetical protein
MGAAVAAANNLTLGNDGNFFSITGSTQINALTTSNWQSGSEIAFIFTGTPILKNNTVGGGGTAPMLLAGGIDYTASPGDYIGFRYDGSFWHETNRKLASSGGVYTFSNGLTESPATQVKLGGTLTQNTTIFGGGLFTAISGGRFEIGQGASVAAANNLTLGSDGNLFTITGNTQITAITTTNWQLGSTISFIFTGTPVLKNNTAGGAGTAPMLLAGRVDYTAAVGDYIAFQYNGTNWYETNRKLTGSVSSGLTTANNGLTANTATNVQLGGVFANTTLDGSTTGALIIQGSTNTVNGLLFVNNTLASGNNVAIKGQSIDGGAVVGVSSTNAGVSGASTSGNGGSFQSGSAIALAASTTTGSLAATFAVNPASTNTVVPVAQLQRFTTGATANGIGGALQWVLPNTGGNNTAGGINLKYTNVTFGSLSSEFDFQTVNASGVLTTRFSIGSNASFAINRLEYAKGANISGTGDLTLGVDGNVFHITGTTTINAIIIADWQAGSEIILIFDGSLTVKNNTAGGAGTAKMLLAGGIDFSATPNDVLTLIWDGTSFFEKCRSVN